MTSGPRGMYTMTQKRTQVKYFKIQLTLSEYSIYYSKKKSKINFMFNIAHVIQVVMDLLKIFRMQEPISKTELLVKTNNEPQKENFQEIILGNKIIIKELEGKVKELEIKNQDLEQRNKLFNANGTENSEYHKVMKGYDKFILKIMEESEQVAKQKSQLETYTKELSEKYERAKIVIEQYKGNEDVLKNTLQQYEEKIKNLTDQYNNLSQHCQMKLTNANLEIARASKENVFQVGQLKEMLLKKQATINELQKNPKLEKKYSNSMFKPLKGL